MKNQDKNFGIKVAKTILKDMDNPKDISLVCKLCELILNTEAENGIKYPVEYYQGIASEFYKMESEEKRSEKVYQSL